MTSTEIVQRWVDFGTRMRARQARLAAEIAAEREAWITASVRRLETGRERAFEAMGLPAGGEIMRALGAVVWTPLVNAVTGWASSDDRQPFLVLRPENDQVDARTGLGATGAGKSVAACTLLFRTLRKFRKVVHEADSDALEMDEWDPGQGYYVTMCALRMASRLDPAWHGETVMARACRVRYLVLDEIRTCDLGGVGQERLEELVETRNRRAAWTVCTSNLGATALGTALGQRVASRWGPAAAKLRIPGGAKPVDFRLKPDALLASPDCPLHGMPAMRRDDGACDCPAVAR